ncbi:MAG: hypothetical protein HFH87_00960 [Lachnospiraceae bacterium]|nr:hypothetical protein [Lachnospiraceae bacterium]
MKKRYACLAFVGIFCSGFYLGGKSLVRMINEYKKGMERNYVNMILLNNWLNFLYSGKKIEEYFHLHNYNRIMIYGNGYIGKRLFQSLMKTDIQVASIMDREVPVDTGNIVIGIESDVPEVDCIVVTPVFYYEEIVNLLNEKTKIPIISIENVIELDNK